MKAKSPTVVVLLAIFALTLSGLATASVGAIPRVASQLATTDSPQARVTEALRSSPMMFIENVGQFADGARFQVRGDDKTIWLAEDAIWVTVVEEPHPTPGPSGHLSPLSAAERREGPRVRSEVRGVNIKLSFPGSNPHPCIEPFNRLDTVVSYFIGNDPAKWHPNVPVWGGVRYKDLYPGIDLEITSEGGRLVQRLVARPGAALSAVRLRVEGPDSMVLLPEGDGLLLRTAVGEFTLPLLGLGGEISEPAAVRSLDARTFEVTVPFLPASSPAPGVASVAQLSAVAPQAVSLLYSTFLGGSGTEDPHAIAVDSSGAVYVTGDTHASPDFPVTPGAFDTSGGVGFVVKVAPGGGSLVYATFLDAEGRGITVDSSGAVYVTGTAGDCLPTTPGAFDTTFNGPRGYWPQDAFVIKLTMAHF